MKPHEICKKLLRSQAGASSIFFALSLGVIVTSAALTIDVGIVTVEKSKLSNSIDSATLAGAQEMVAHYDNTSAVVRNYVQKNSGALKELTITADQNARTIEVKGVKTVQNFFGQVFNKPNEDILSIAKAKVENIVSLNGARPMAVVQQTFNYGQIYTLKEGASDGTSGNYAAIALGGTGGSTYRDNLLYGYSGTIRVGDVIPTETGNISGTTQTCINQLMHQCTHSPPCTYQYYNKNCAKIIFIPIVNTLDVNGRKCINVLGFGTFFLEGVDNHGGHTDVIGRFITYSMEGETSSAINDYGTYGIQLIK